MLGYILGWGSKQTHSKGPPPPLLIIIALKKKQKMGLTCGADRQCIQYVVVQFYPWFKSYFPLF